MQIDPPIARRDTIAARLAQGQSVVAATVATEFGVSEDAIRRDLRALAAEGRCRRVYGGALPISAATAPIIARSEERQAEKRVLARAAAATIRPGELVFIDSGSTNLALVEFLPEDADITLVTNAADIAAAILRRQDLRLIIIGGVADPMVGGCVDGSAAQAITQMRIDRAFIGACAVSEDGVGAFHFEDATFKRAVIAAAARTLVIATNDKLETPATHRIATLDQIDTLVVEPDITAAHRAMLDASGCRSVLRASAI